MTLKIAIVGCGKIADGHVEEILKMPEVARVVAVCDLELLMAEQVALRYGIDRFYDRFDRMLETEKPDVVHVTTPPEAHLPLALAAIDAGCHVYVEKPFTLNAADSRRLLEHAERAGRKVTIGYSYLFDPPALAMRELLDRGVIGEPVHVEIFYGYNLAGPFGSAVLGDATHWVHRLPGKLIHNNIDHILYRATELLDDERPKITAFASVRRPGRFGDARDRMQDELRLVIEGARTTAYGTFSSHIKPAGYFVRVCGTKNTLHVDHAKRTVTLEGGANLPSAFGRLVPAFEQALQFAREGGKNVLRFARSDFHYFAGLRHLLALYYRSIRGGGPPPVPYRDILRISEMIDEIVRQTSGEPAGA
jgi:predicted dehydrogenase